MIKRLYYIFYETNSVTQKILLLIIGIMFYFPFIGSIHLFDWDEINFAEISREMLLTGDYFKSQINFHAFYEKPPLFNWIQIGSFTLFGNNEFAARFPNALFGVFSLLLIYRIGKKIRGNKFGMLWALLYLGSFLPHFYFKSGIIDPIFNFFIFFSIYLLFCAYGNKNSKKKNQYFFLSGLVTGLSLITKGPVGLLIVILLIVLYKILYNRLFLWKHIKYCFIFGGAVGLITLFWLLPQYINSSKEFIIVFTTYMWELLTQDVATHGQPFYYHFFVVFIGCFPISIIALNNIISLQKKTKIDFNRWMFILFWVVLLLFSMVKTKIVHYSSMTYFPLAYLAADSLINLNKNETYQKLFRRLYLFFGILFVVLFAFTPFLLIDKSFLLGLLSKDKFAQEIIKILEIPVTYSFISILLFAGIIISFFLFKKRKIYEAVVTHSLIFALFLNIELAFLLPPVEYAVQGPAIEFYKRYANQEVYLTTFGFKSYGCIYYFNKSAWQAKYSDDELLNKPLDKPVYLITKVNSPHVKTIKNIENIKLIEKKGGFLLFLKSPANF